MELRSTFRVHSMELVPIGGKDLEVKRRVRLVPTGEDLYTDTGPAGFLEMIIVKPEYEDQFEMYAEYEIQFTFSKVKPGFSIKVTRSG